MMIRVESPAEEYQKHLEKAVEPYTPEKFLMERCLRNKELLEEISHELAEVRLNYDEVLKRLSKYEPVDDLVETEYKPFGGIRWG